MKTSCLIIRSDIDPAKSACGCYEKRRLLVQQSHNTFRASHLQYVNEGKCYDGKAHEKPSNLAGWLTRVDLFYFCSRY